MRKIYTYKGRAYYSANEVIDAIKVHEHKIVSKKNLKLYCTIREEHDPIARVSLKDVARASKLEENTRRTRAEQKYYSSPTVTFGDTTIIADHETILRLLLCERSKTDCFLYQHDKVLKIPYDNIGNWLTLISDEKLDSSFIT